MQENVRLPHSESLHVFMMITKAFLPLCMAMEEFDINSDPLASGSQAPVPRIVL